MTWPEAAVRITMMLSITGIIGIILYGWYKIIK